MKISIKILLNFVAIIVIAGCSKTEELISPYHYDIISPVQNFKLISIDSSQTGKLRVNLSWTLSDTTNLRFFEIYRSQKNPDNFKIIVSNYRELNFSDSTIPTVNDSLRLYYIVYPIGTKIDVRTGVQVSFIGPPSDTLVVNIKKLK